MAASGTSVSTQNETMNQIRKTAECAICFEVMTRPTLLPCGHSFCEHCFLRLVNSNFVLMKCPECMKEHPLPEYYLPDDYKFKHICEDLKRLELDETTSSVPRSIVRSGPTERQPVAQHCYVDPLKEDLYEIDQEILLELQLCDDDERVLPGDCTTNIKAICVDMATTYHDMDWTLLKSGKYQLKYTPQTYGVHQVLVWVFEKLVKGMPLNIAVRPHGKLTSLITGYPGLKMLSDVHFWKGDCLVADKGQNKMSLMDCLGIEKCTFEPPLRDGTDSNFSPFAIATHANQIFITDRGYRCVHIFYGEIDTSGKPKYRKSFGEDVLIDPTGIDIDNSGNVYVADFIKKNVYIFDNNFFCTRSLFTHEVQVPCLRHPQMMKLTKDQEYLIIADPDAVGTPNPKPNVKIVSMKGTVLKEIPTEIRCKSANPYGIAVDENDTIFVSATRYDERKASGAILVFDMKGIELGYLGGIPRGQGGNEVSELIKPGGLHIKKTTRVAHTHCFL